MSTSPTADQLPPAGPSNRVYREPCVLPPTSRVTWVKVACPVCGKFICKATPGSTIQVVCHRCKAESITTVAA